eukprot:CAMPEP_0170428674 /NCGR_PEP_ID=MMETSP0117_2-20130122/39895_1 /TAXON_ID=400756 /ORGANISM="Durinskia baltica, Strain CSIRO CS-38" /LENGTH=62 /DNA_ID=CAMNT_0010687981 /DNA_START=244 /DNA_END=432 /DNA_ORIENTATION=+
MALTQLDHSRMAEDLVHLPLEACRTSLVVGRAIFRRQREHRKSWVLRTMASAGGPGGCLCIR